MNIEEFKEYKKRYPRKQKVNTNALGKMVITLRHISENAQNVNVNEVAKQFNVSRSTFMACIVLGYMNRSNYQYQWLVGEPTRQMAINVIEYGRVYSLYCAENQQQKADLPKVEKTPKAPKSDDLVIYKKVKKNIKLPFGFILTREVLELVK